MDEFKDFERVIEMDMRKCVWWRSLKGQNERQMDNREDQEE